jgi:hypothetical protein
MPEEIQQDAAAGENAPPSDTTATAAAATQAAQEIAKELAIHISGRTFFSLCSYMGSKPIRQVLHLRQYLWQVQREQACLSEQALPATVWLPESAIQTLGEWMYNCPCDEVFPLLNAYETEVQAFLQKHKADKEAADRKLAEAVAQAKETQEATQTEAGETLVTEDTSSPASEVKPDADAEGLPKADDALPAATVPQAGSMQ